VTTEQYWTLQKKGCAICGSQISMDGLRRLALDHDHETGEFRGALCHECNCYRVGSNTLETAMKVVEYLKKGEV
jgi:hypothetical protein